MSRWESPCSSSPLNQLEIPHPQFPIPYPHAFGVSFLEPLTLPLPKIWTKSPRASPQPEAPTKIPSIQWQIPRVLSSELDETPCVSHHYIKLCICNAKLTKYFFAFFQRNSHQYNLQKIINFWGNVPQTPYHGSALDPIGDFHPWWTPLVSAPAIWLLDNSQICQLASWTSRGLDNLRYCGCSRH